jgi:uncharacterized protein YodC (DUF2158 family)
MSQKHNFKIGDIVVLNSGGPDMKIIGILEEDLVYRSIECMWKDNREISKFHNFHPATIHLKEEK